MPVSYTHLDVYKRQFGDPAEMTPENTFSNYSIISVEKDLRRVLEKINGLITENKVEKFNLKCGTIETLLELN